MNNDERTGRRAGYYVLQNGGLKLTPSQRKRLNKKDRKGKKRDTEVMSVEEEG